MAELHLRWPDLKQGLTLETGQTHRIIIERVPVYRLAVADEHAAISSGEARSVDFSADDLWKELIASHEKFARTFREHPFDPEASGAGVDGHPGTRVLAAALRFLDENPPFRLLIAGHAGPSGDTGQERRTSDARARSVLAMLEGDRDAFVKACRDLGDKARGACFDDHQDELAALADPSLRSQLRFVSAEKKFLACGARYAVENAWRVDLLFFDRPEVPDPVDERTPDLIYERNLFRLEELDPGELLRVSSALTIVDAPAPEPGVGDPDEPLETRMASLGVSDAADPWAFLEPFDSAMPAPTPA